MRICSFSDNHGILPSIDEIPDCDILTIAGDVCPCRGKSPATIPLQLGWLNTTFYDWIHKVELKGIRVAFCPGNHDFIFQSDEFRFIFSYVRRRCFIDSGFSIEENGKYINFWFSPWQNYFGGWAYNLYEIELVEKWALIPTGTHVLTVHSPPYGILDYTYGGKHLGSTTLTERINDLQSLRLMTYGHIHLTGGAETKYGDAILANVSYLDEEYRPWGKSLKVWEI